MRRKATVDVLRLSIARPLRVAPTLCLASVPGDANVRFMSPHINPDICSFSRESHWIPACQPVSVLALVSSRSAFKHHRLSGLVTSLELWLGLAAAHAHNCERGRKLSSLLGQSTQR
jgi:hypothetical protein